MEEFAKLNATSLTSSRLVNVKMPANVAYDLEKSIVVIKDIVGKLGCPACHSGFDIRFIMERDFVVNPHTLEVRGVSDIVEKF